MKTTKLSDGVGLYAVSMGKVFRVTHVLPDTESANKAMEQDKNTALIALDNNGLHYLAKVYGSVCPSVILADHGRYSTHSLYEQGEALTNLTRYNKQPSGASL